jgi:hypothetical protein
MDREQLFASIVAACPGRDDLVYLERHGDQYRWRVVSADDAIVDLPTSGGPDVWMSFSAGPQDPGRMRVFFDDVLAELESMADTAPWGRAKRRGESTDRCRWPIDEPWPHFH